jgi:hypothetical protein
LILACSSAAPTDFGLAGGVASFARGFEKFLYGAEVGLEPFARVVADSCFMDVSWVFFVLTRIDIMGCCMVDDMRVC